MTFELLVEFLTFPLNPAVPQPAEAEDGAITTDDSTNRRPTSPFHIHAFVIADDHKLLNVSHQCLRLVTRQHRPCGFLTKSDVALRV